MAPDSLAGTRYDDEPVRVARVLVYGKSESDGKDDLFRPDGGAIRQGSIGSEGRPEGSPKRMCTQLRGSHGRLSKGLTED